MQTAGARVRRDDEQDLTREAVLLEWERKIDAAERTQGRFEPPTAVPADRAAQTPAEPSHPHADAPVESVPTDGGPPPQSRRFDRRAPAPAQLLPERRTITITGKPAPSPARRRSSLAERQLAQPDRIALWAFLLGLVLVAVAAGTAHA
jgi:hypothetical protein